LTKCSKIAISAAWSFAPDPTKRAYSASRPLAGFQRKYFAARGEEEKKERRGNERGGGDVPGALKYFNNR